MPTFFETRSINLALQILREVLPQCGGNDVGTPAVRLALRTLHPLAGDATREFWKHACEPNHPWESGHLPYARIVRALQANGVEVDRENVLD